MESNNSGFVLGDDCFSASLFNEKVKYNGSMGQIIGITKKGERRFIVRILSEKNKGRIEQWLMRDVVFV